jgi:hypothetical protein
VKIGNKFGTENRVLGFLSKSVLEVLLVDLFSASHIEISYANKYKLK